MDSRESTVEVDILVPWGLGRTTATGRMLQGQDCADYIASFIKGHTLAMNTMTASPR